MLRIFTGLSVTEDIWSWVSDEVGMAVRSTFINVFACTEYVAGYRVATSLTSLLIRVIVMLLLFLLLLLLQFSLLL